MKKPLFTRFGQVVDIIKSFLLPFFLAIYPSLFHYTNNSSIVLIPSLYRMIVFNAIIATLIYLICVLVYKGQSTRAAIAAFILLMFFNTYGIAFNYFKKVDLFLVEHYTFLPLTILIAIYAAWLITKGVKSYSTQVWTVLVFIFGGLVAFNTISIIPKEIEKKPEQTDASSVQMVGQISATSSYPDIYFLVYDEFSGLEPMREYWHNGKVDEFKAFLESKGFFVAEQSHGGSIDTIQEAATRLNYQSYSTEKVSVETMFRDIANNKVMSYLKTKGYTTVAFDETRASFAYPAALPIQADYLYEGSEGTSQDLGVLFDEFGILVADNTMLYAISNNYTISNPAFEEHRNMVLFTTQKLTDLKEIHSPKFVYVHLLVPHKPFMFDENGNIVNPQFYQNWNYYLGNYNYAISLIEETITGILANADPQNPPIIIVQSDHGARNQGTGAPGSILLQDYPEKFMTNILFSLYFPGYDTSKLEQDINPVNTFPIIFNHLFHAQIPLE